MALVYERVEVDVVEEVTEAAAASEEVIAVEVASSVAAHASAPLEVSVSSGSPQVSAVVSDVAPINAVVVDGTPTIIEIAGEQGPPGIAIAEDEVQYDVEVENASSTVTYVGQAAPGTATNAAAWRIKRITDTGSTVTVDWANGSDAFDQIWDDRATLTYGP